MWWKKEKTDCCSFWRLLCDKHCELAGRMCTWWLAGCPLWTPSWRRRRPTVTPATGCSSPENRPPAPSSTSSPGACWRTPSKSPTSLPPASAPVCTRPSTISARWVKSFKLRLKAVAFKLEHSWPPLFSGHPGRVFQRAGVQLHVLLAVLLSRLRHRAAQIRPPGLEPQLPLQHRRPHHLSQRPVQPLRGQHQSNGFILGCSRSNFYSSIPNVFSSCTFIIIIIIIMVPRVKLPPMT